MHHRTKRQRDTPVSKRATKTLRGALGWCRIQRSRSRWARHARRRDDKGPAVLQFGPAGRFASGTFSGGSVGSEKCTAHSATRKATMAAPIKSYLSQRRPALFWRAAGRTEPRMDASRSGPSGESLIGGISGPGGCGRGDSPGGGGAGCLGIGSLQRRFCSAYLGIKTHVRISSHGSGACEQGVRAGGWETKKAPRKRGAPISTPEGVPAKGHTTLGQPARCLVAQKPHRCQKADKISRNLARLCSLFVLGFGLWTKAEKLRLRVRPGTSSRIV